MKIADSHAHLYDTRFDKDRKQVIRRAIDSNIGIIVVPGEDTETAKMAIALSQIYPNLIFPAVGFHPHNTKKFNKEELIKELDTGKYVAIGEIGLDYYYDKDVKKEQQYLLRMQFELSLRYNLPVILHVRDAFCDIFKIIDEFEGIYGVFHSFSGEHSEVQEALKRGFYISFSGIVTFKNAKNIQEAVLKVPLNRLLIETDSPYLSPVPKRGRRNEPSYIVHTIHKIAELLEIPTEDVIRYTYENTKRLFKIPFGTT